MPRSALIIDDSRTALVSLGRLLKAQGIAVDMVESGPEALDYLRSNAHPGVIFLDHMMPGMDGFETLSAIKRSGPSATIPVVMYTSKEGDAYMGQALALGAVGLLHKPVDPAELAAVLGRVDRLRGTPPRTAPAAEMPPRRTPTAVTGVINVPEALRTSATRPAANSARADNTETRPARPRHAGRWWTAAFMALLLFTTGWYALRAQQIDLQRRALSEENARLRNEQELTRAATASAEQRSELEVRARPTPAQNRALLDTLAWAINQNNQYGLNEEPLNDSRLSLVRELVARLTSAGFEGTVRLETHVAEFCLTRDEQGSLRLPSDVTPFLRCEVISYPPAQAQLLGNRQSPAFARFLAQPRSGAIQIVVVSHGASRPLVSYPDRASVQTAGDWNQIARINHRVEVVLVPAP